MAETFDNRGGVSGGRKKISEQGRANSFSKRALQGKIQIVNKRCPYCNHHKIKRNEAPDSPFFDKEYCTRCKREIIRGK